MPGAKMRIQSQLPGLVILLLLIACPVQAEQAPVVAVEEPVFDFGDIFQGDAVTHEFRFRNDGDAPLVIDRVKSSCGCTAVLAADKTVPPGQSSALTARFDSGRFRGNVQKLIYLYSNDPARPMVQLKVKANVIPILDIEPATASFGIINSDETPSMELTVTNRGEVPLRITGVKTANLAGVSAELDNDLLAAGASTRLQVRVLENRPDSRLNGYVLFRTDNRALGEIRLPVRGVFAARPKK